MISASSEALSKCEAQNGAALGSPRKGKKRWLAPLLLMLLALTLLAGPTIFLNLLLINMFPPESGLKLSYSRARAGFLFHSAYVENIKLQSISANEGAPVLTIELLTLDGIARKNLIDLVRDPSSPAPVPLYLARDAAIKNARLESSVIKAGLAQINARDLLAAPGDSGSALPFLFERLEAVDLNYSINLPQASQRFRLSHLEARQLDQENLGLLKLKMLNNRYELAGTPPRSSELALNGLTVGGLKLSAFKQARKNQGGSFPLWWLLSGCDTLELARAELFLNDRQAVSLKSALYDFDSPRPDEISYRRHLSFEVNAGVLALESASPFWADLRDIAGDNFEGELAAELDYGNSEGQARLKSARLDLAGLGLIDLKGLIFGVQAAKAYYSPYQILFGANTWKVEELSFLFEDRGLARRFYRHLDRTAFAGLSGRSTEANIMEHYAARLKGALESEGRLANPAAIYSEVEAFVYQPDRLRLSLNPKPPLTMKSLHLSNILSLANIDKYDIIDKLCLTIEVGDRAPILVAVDSDSAPDSPSPSHKPLDKGLDPPLAEENF